MSATREQKVSFLDRPAYDFLKREVRDAAAKINADADETADVSRVLMV
jgi:hypothetical protein